MNGAPALTTKHPGSDECLWLIQERAEAARVGGSAAASALTTGGYWGECLWLRLE